MVKSTTARPTPIWKRILEVFVVIVVFLVTIIVGFQVFRIVYEQPPEDMIKVSDQFAFQHSWQLVADHTEPRRVLCVDMECPSIWKQWKTDTLLTHTEFENILHNSGWDFKIDGSCALSNPTRSGNDIDVCSASGTVSGYSVNVWVTASNPLKSSGIKLSISRN